MLIKTLTIPDNIARVYLYHSPGIPITCFTSARDANPSDAGIS